MIHKVSCLCVCHSASLSYIFTSPSVVVFRTWAVCQSAVVLLSLYERTGVYGCSSPNSTHTAPGCSSFLCSPCCLCHMAIFTSHPALQDIIFVVCRPVVHHLFIYFFVAWCVQEKCTIVQVFLTTIFRDILTHRGRCCNHLQI